MRFGNDDDPNADYDPRPSSFQNSSQVTSSPPQRRSKVSASTLIEKLLKEKSSNKRRPRRDYDYFAPENETLEGMKEFLQDMIFAARKDWNANLNGKPAIHCMKMLPRVIRELSKKLLYNTYLDEHLLDALRDWVHPLPNKSLPPLKVRTEIYRIVEKVCYHFCFSIVLGSVCVQFRCANLRDLNLT